VLITSQAVLGAGDFVYFLNVPVTVAVRCLGGGNADETRQTRSRAGSRPMTGCRERAKPGELYRSGLLVALRALVIRLQPRAPNLQSHQPILASSSRASTSSLLLAVHSSALLLEKKSPAAKLGLGSWHDAGGLAGPMVASAMTAVTTARLLAVWALCAGLLSHIRLQWPYYLHATVHYQTVPAPADVPCLSCTSPGCIIDFFGSGILGLGVRRVFVLVRGPAASQAMKIVPPFDSEQCC